MRARRKETAKSRKEQGTRATARAACVPHDLQNFASSSLTVAHDAQTPADVVRLRRLVCLCRAVDSASAVRRQRAAAAPAFTSRFASSRSICSR